MAGEDLKQIFFLCEWMSCEAYGCVSVWGFPDSTFSGF
jgi:hypothetical protein